MGNYKEMCIFSFHNILKKELIKIKLIKYKIDLWYTHKYNAWQCLELHTHDMMVDKGLYSWDIPLRNSKWQVGNKN